MEERIQGDARIYILSTLFFACILAGGLFLCLYLFQSEAESTSWYAVVGIILVGIPWIFWICAYMYRCCANCCWQRNGGNVNRVHNSLTKTQSYASAAPTARTVHPSENGDSPLKSSNGDQRRVHFGEVVVMGSKRFNRNDHVDESPREDAIRCSGTEHEGKENSHDSIPSNKDYISS